jgi:hypothetical protein
MHSPLRTRKPSCAASAWERRVVGAEVAPDAEVLIALPARLGEVEDEPALARDDLAGLGVGDRGLGDGIHR